MILIIYINNLSLTTRIKYACINRLGVTAEGGDDDDDDDDEVPDLVENFS